MRGILQEEFSRAFLNKRFVIVAFLAGLSIVYGTIHVLEIQWDNPLGAVTIWQQILWRGSYGFFAALMVGLPFADSLLADRGHQYLTQILMRCTYKQYLWAKILANLCAGAAAVVLPMLLLLAGCCLAYPLTPYNFPTIPTEIAKILHPNVFKPGAALVFSLPGYLSLCILMATLFGAAYATLGLGISLLVRNAYIVLGFPFICYSLGYYIIPTSKHLFWLGSTEAALLPVANLLSPFLQYLGIFILSTACWLAFGKKERLLFN
jgi:hypothetical protein